MSKQKGPDDLTIASGIVLTPGSEYEEGHREESYILTQRIEDLIKPKSGIPETPKEAKAVNTDMENELVFTKPETKPRYVVFDIESYMDSNLKDEYIDFKTGEKMGNLKDPLKIEAKKAERRNKLALSPLTGEIILVGFLTSDENGKQITQIGLSGATEKMILTEVAERLIYYYQMNYRFISFGGKRFDLPYIYFRSLIAGLKLNLPPLNQLNYKYENKTHFDLENIFEEGGLAEWGYRFGYSNDFKNDGGNIADYYFNKEYDKIRNKNAMDLKLTWTMFDLMKDMI